MFDFLEMCGNYKERVVANDIINGVTIDTAAETDSDQPYETGINGKMYNGNEWVIVELYDTKEEAINGHKKWVELFKKEFPETLTDVSSSTICKLANLFRDNPRIYSKNG